MQTAPCLFLLTSNAVEALNKNAHALGGFEFVSIGFAAVRDLRASAETAPAFPVAALNPRHETQQAPYPLKLDPKSCAPGVPVVY